MKNLVHKEHNAGSMKQIVMFPAQKINKNNVLFKRNIPAYHMGKEIIIQVEENTYQNAKRLAWSSRWLRWIMTFTFIVYSTLAIVFPQIGSASLTTIWGFCLISAWIFSWLTPKTAEKIIARKVKRQYATEEFKELLPASVVYMLQTPFLEYRN